MHVFKTKRDRLAARRKINQEQRDGDARSADYVKGLNIGADRAYLARNNRKISRIAARV